MDTTTTFKFDNMPFHHVVMKDRKSLDLSGVKTIESFDATEFLMETTLGFLNIKGEGLGLARYDQELMPFVMWKIVKQISHLKKSS